VAVNEIQRLKERHTRLLLEAQNARQMVEDIRTQSADHPTGDDYSRIRSLETKAGQAERDAADAAFQIAKSRREVPLPLRNEHVKQDAERQGVLREMLRVYRSTEDPGHVAAAHQTLVAAAHILVVGARPEDTVQLVETYATGEPKDWERFVRGLYWRSRVREVEYHVVPPAMAMISMAELRDLFRAADQGDQPAVGELRDFGTYLAYYIGLVVSWRDAIELSRLFMETAPDDEATFGEFGQRAAKDFSGDHPRGYRLFRGLNDLPAAGRIRIF
jgi:hypothetical protein